MRKTVLERFWEKVNATAGDDACWFWLAARSKAGYGVFRAADMSLTYAHRWSLEHALGRPLGAGMEALHRCDTPPCVNPSHLREGTRQENVDDAVNRLRAARGNRLPIAKLDPGLVLSIRKRAAAGESASSLAAAFCVSRAAIHKVIKGETWKHVGGPMLNMSGVS